MVATITVHSIVSRSVATVGGISDRKQEIKRRRRQKKKMSIIKRKLKKANAGEKSVLAEKIRRMTTGAEVIIANLGLDDSGKKR